MTAVEIIVSLFLLAGTAVMLLAAAGLLRFGDVYLRMHAATKSSTLGIGFILVGVAIFFGELLITVKLIALAIIYFFIAATGAQVLAHAAHVARVPVAREMWIDQLAENQASEAETEPPPDSAILED